MARAFARAAADRQRFGRRAPLADTAAPLAAPPRRPASPVFAPRVAFIMADRAEASKRPTTKQVTVHPIVLLSAVDHYNRVAGGTKKRVVGMLLGEESKDGVHALSSYALPFEEDDRDPNIWFLDHEYHETMYAMCRKVNVREKLVGWYTTGPKIKSGDLKIDQLVRRYIPNPVMVIIDVKPKEIGIPTEAYQAVEEILEGQQQQWTFKHVPCEIGASESEEVGVEHLLRDVKDMTISTLANQVTQKLGALRGLAARLQEVDTYLHNVLSGRLPVNHQIVYKLQDVFNLLPNLHVESLVKAFAVKTNDMMLAVYLASIIRAIVAMHNLLNNKLLNREKEQAAEAKEAKALEEKAAAKDEKAKAEKEGKENEGEKKAE
jgi:26S proteasome regulatory subunit N8